VRQLVKKCTKEDIGDLADAEYANDSCLLAECLENIIQLTDLLAEESQKWGLDKNAKKTKQKWCQYCYEEAQVTIGDMEVELVQSL